MRVVDIGVDRVKELSVERRIRAVDGKITRQQTTRAIIAEGDWDEVVVGAKVASDLGDLPLAALGFVRAIILSDDKSASQLLALGRSLQQTLTALHLSREDADAWLRDALAGVNLERLASLKDQVDSALAGGMPPFKDASKETDETRGLIDALVGEDRAQFRIAQDGLTRILAALDAIELDDGKKRPRQQSNAVFMAFLALSTGCCCLVWFLGEFLPTPSGGIASRQFWLVAIYVWTPALLGSWVAAYINASRTRVLSYVSPTHFGSSGGVVGGQHESFAKDSFFHIFQFVWLPVLCYIFLFELNLPSLQELALSSVPAAQTQAFDLGALIGSIDQPLTLAIGSAAGGHFTELLVNEQAGWVFGILVGLISIAKQISLQNSRRRTHVDFFWWDIRTGWQTWLIRLVMVGVDMAFGAVMLQKIIFYNVAVATILIYGSPEVSMFAADGFGGLGVLRNGVFVNAFGALVLGAFVISSWYLHFRLPQYRDTDMILGVIYGVVVVVFILAPALRLEFVLASGIMAEKELIIAQLEAAGRLSDPSVLNGVVQIQSWSASLLDPSIQNSPLYAIAVQIGGLGYSTLRRRHGISTLRSSA